MQQVLATLGAIPPFYPADAMTKGKNPCELPGGRGERLPADPGGVAGANPAHRAILQAAQATRERAEAQRHEPVEFLRPWVR